MVLRTILDQLAFTASLTVDFRCIRVALNAPMRTLTGLVSRVYGLLGEAQITVNPVAHLFSSDSFPPLATSFHSENCGFLNTFPRKLDHFAIVRAARIRASGWKIIEHFGSRNKQRIGEKYLRIRSRMVREQNDKRGSLFKQNSTESQVNLWKARGPTLTMESVCEAHV
jgi:hypothetical protein